MGERRGGALGWRWSVGRVTGGARAGGEAPYPVAEGGAGGQRLIWAAPLVATALASPLVTYPAV